MRSVSLGKIRVRDIMTRNVITAKIEETIEDALDKMIRNEVECLPVIDDERRVRGILTFRDIMRLIHERKSLGKAKVKDIMTRSVLAVNSSMTLLELVKLMKRKGMRRFPVVDSNGRLIGIVTDFDLAVFGFHVK